MPDEETKSTRSRSKSTRSINFTKRTLESLLPPVTGKRDYYSDIRTRGLRLCVTETGTKSFHVYRKINGRPERITLGRFPDLSVEQARGRASDVNARIAMGENPNDVRRALRGEVTFSRLFTEYMERHAKVHKRSWNGDQEQYDRYLSQWGSRKVSQISHRHIEALHSRVGRENGRYAANRLVALLSAVYSKGQKWQLVSENPAKGVTRFREKPRERFLLGDELPQFFTALENESDGDLRDYIWLSLLTGARKANVLGMRWEDIDLSRETWTIPQTKNSTPHTVPLVPKAVEILEARSAAPDRNEWVFAGSGKTGHLIDLKKGWKNFLSRAGIEDLRLHDLRRSLGSWQAATNTALPIIGKTLAHKSPNTTAIYARLDLDPVRDSMRRATDAMFEAAKSSSPPTRQGSGE